MAIITYSDYTAVFGTQGLSQAQIEMYISIVEQEIKDWCGTALESATYSAEVHSGDGGDALFVKNPPITTLTSITIITGANSSTVYSGTSLNDNFVWDTDFKGEIRWRNAITGRIVVDDFGIIGADEFGTSPAFPEGYRNISISYIGGYTSGTMPANLKQAVRELVAARIARLGTTGAVDGSMKSESLGSYSYTRGDAEETGKMFASKLWKWKRHTV